VPTCLPPAGGPCPQRPLGRDCPGAAAPVHVSGPPGLGRRAAAALKTLRKKTEQLRAAVAALRAKKVADDVVIEVEIFLKAAENIVRFDEWFAKDSVKWTLLALRRESPDGVATWSR